MFGAAVGFLTLVLLIGFAGRLHGGPAPLEPLPPDLPLPAAPPSREPWLRWANVLQPYGRSQFTALTQVGDRPQRLSREFGFNAITVLPPDAHNVLTDVPLSVQEHLTEAQFREGVAGYRAAGYRLILYTSVMASGMCPEFQSGQLAREHPDWLQRDPKGNPVMVYGVPWLCPSTPAREYVLQRAVRLTREYQPDGILLDNNMFYFTKEGWTCHCAACTRAFREYVRRRLGPDRARRLFGVAPADLEIPSREGSLFALWLNWRNRVWADVNETFRARLRQVNPRIMLFANTQYLFGNASLASDLQFEHEDIVISESRGLSSWQLSEKIVLGQALAAGRPLWNYIGTFVNASDYTGLKPPEVTSPLIATTIAHGALPWIVDGFDDGPTDARARREMSTLLAWHNTHPELFTNTPWARCGVVLSLPSRNALHRPLLPPHLMALLQAGIPVTALRDEELRADKLRPFRVITVETSACLEEAAARALAKWVRAGGELIASPDVGSCDSLGRHRPGSCLWRALGLGAAPARETAVGRGKVMVAEPAAFAQAALSRASADSFLLAPSAGVEVVPYRAPGSLLLHLVRHGPAPQPVVLRLPASFQLAERTARLSVPGAAGPQILSLSPGADRAILTLTNLPTCSVLRIPVR